MVRRRTEKGESARSPDARARLVVALMVLAGALALFLAIHYARPAAGSQVPNPDRTAMEPQVAAKIGEAREAVLAAPTSAEAWGRFAMVLQAHRLESDAAVCYRRAAELSPGEFRWQYLLAHALKDTDAQGALAVAEASSRLNPDYAPLYVFRGQLLETFNRVDEAMAQYQKAVELDPKNTMAEFGLGRLYLARGEVEEALRYLLTARDLSEDVGAIHGVLAQAYRQRGDMKSALRENRLGSQRTETISIADPIHYAMRKESVSSSAQLQRAIEADEAGDHETAERLYQELVRLRPDDADIRVRFGDILARQGKLGPAKQQYQAALAASPQLPSAHYGLGNVLNLEADYEGAAKHYRATLEVTPDHARTLVNLGAILAFQGRLEEAASLYRRALESNPKAFAPNLQLGRVLSQKHSYHEAIPYLDAAIEARPDSGSAHRQLSLALIAVGDYRGAWKELERAQELGEKMPAPIVEELRRRVTSN